MINSIVLVSDADNFALEAHINPYYGAGALDRGKARREHAEVVAVFRRAGIEVMQVASPVGAQDGVYTANWGLVYNGKAVLSRLPNVRTLEEAYAEQVLTKLGYDVVKVPEDWLFSGQGDALICGDFLLAGSGYRSDARAQEFVAEVLGLELVQLHAVPEMRDGEPVINRTTGLADSFFYDIDLAVAVIDEGAIAVCLEALDEASRAKIMALPVEKILVSMEEARQGFGLNLVSTGKTVVMSAAAPRLAESLRARGMELELLEITELAKGGGFIRCVSLTLA
ncbi:arginine deiminase-related protein [Candidatus Saccharibacteria bacterium]|nr:arginine deiminase-related protein [Candidatus Saccharibacteria bacterium]